MVRKGEFKGGDDFEYRVELPTLQEMASYQVCLSISYSHLSSPRYILALSGIIWDWFPYLGAKTTYRGDIDKTIGSLRTPRCIEEMLKKEANKIRDELRDWAKHLGKDLFPDVMREYSLLQIDPGWCVWMANGEIDYRKSALKMLDSGRLSEVQKFVVMSKYCMEDQIKTISLESLPECIRKVKYDTDPVLFYWICYLKNELHEIPCQTSVSLYTTIAKECYGCRRMALEYFWRRSLNDDMCHSLAHLVVYKCTDSRTWSICERLLSLENSDSSSSSYIADEKLIVSSIYSKSSQYPLWLWNHFKHHITGKEFGEFIKEMLKRVSSVEAKMKLLMDIWNTADDNHRNYVVSEIGGNIFFKCFYGWSSPCSAALEFLISYFSLLPLEARRSTVYYYQSFFPTRVYDVDSLNKILDLCSFDPRELFRLKEYALGSSELFSLGEDSVRNADFDQMNAKLDWVFSEAEPGAALAYKKNLLRKSLPSTELSLLLDLVKWDRLCKFIDETYAKNARKRKALKMKRNFVHFLIVNCEFNLQFRDGFDTVKKVVESVYWSKVLKSIKRLLLAHFSRKLIRYEYWWDEENCDETFFKNFIHWCCDNDQDEISQFKRKFSHDAMLTAILDRLTQHNVYEFQRPVLAGILLERLEKYLIWCLGNKQSVKEYKLLRINSPITDLTFFKRLSDKSCLMVILKWFFDGSETQINEFMSKDESKLSS